MSDHLLDHLFCISLSSRSDVAASTREAANLQREGRKELLADWLARARRTGPADTKHVPSFLYVGTCHRIELYGFGVDAEDVRHLWEQARNCRLASAELKAGLPVLRHLIRVASSLESEVLGETQIMGQVRDYAQEAREAGLLRGPLDWAVQQSLKVAKKIRSGTALGEGTVSVAHVAVDGIADAFDDLGSKSALVVGAGSMAIQALHRLRKKGIRDITWINRTEARIREHAAADSCRIAPYEQLAENIWQHSVSVIATGSPVAIIRLDELKACEKTLRKAGRLAPGPRILLDLGLPRNVEERIHGFGGFYVRDVDEFSNRAEQGSERRRGMVGEAERILENEIQALLGQWEAKDRASLLQELRKSLEEFKSLEREQMKLEKTQEIEYVSQATTAKLIHRLIEQLEEAGEPLASQVLETLLRAWRQPDQWLKKSPSPQVESSEEKNPQAAKLVRLRR